MTKDKLEDFTVREPEPELKGLTMGFDADGKAYVWPCGSCGRFRNNFEMHDSGDFFFCLHCKKVVAVRAVTHGRGRP